MDRQAVLEWVQRQYGTLPDDPWARYPHYAVLRSPRGKWYGVMMDVPRDKLGLLTKCLFIYSERKKGSKKDAHRRHPMYFIILFKFKAVAERRQWSSAASKPRRKTRVKLCPHFWAANVPSHQTCRLRSASR